MLPGHLRASNCYRAVLCILNLFLLSLYILYLFLTHSLSLPYTRTSHYITLH